MCYLFFHFSTLYFLINFIERKVVENAQELTDIPEAIPFLVTPASIEDDLPEFKVTQAYPTTPNIPLKYLLYWAETTPTQAIGLLHASEITNMNVIYYAIRVLKSYSPATMMFYIPQLIQSLRYDVTGNYYFFFIFLFFFNYFKNVFIYFYTFLYILYILYISIYLNLLFYCFFIVFLFFLMY